MCICILGYVDKYFFDRRMQSEAAKKDDEDEKNVFEKLISDENGYVSLVSH